MQSSFDTNLGSLCICFTLLCDWCRKLVLSSQPIRFNTKCNRVLLTRVFPRFNKFALKKKLINLLSFWLIVKFSYPRIGYHDHVGFVFKHSFIERSIMQKYR